jgi:NAD-dependent dihydropyrimidine dehydrogenase PreA subunit
MPAPPPSRAPRLPAIDPDRCTGCGRCVAACGLHLLSLEPVGWHKFATLNEPERCTGCSECAPACPFHAIRMHRRADEAGDSTDALGRADTRK